MKNPTYRRAEDISVETPDDERFDELKVSEYCIFLFALDTYMRYLEEAKTLHVDDNTAEEDTVLRRGLALLRTADRDYLGYIEEELRKSITANVSLSMLKVALAQRPTARGAAIRALKLRTVLTRGGPSTQKAVFGNSTKARREVREAIEAATTEDADVALTKLAMIDIRNSRLEHWIDLASDVAKPLVAPEISPVGEAAKRVAEATQHFATAQLTREDNQEAPETKPLLDHIQASAQEAASKSLRKSEGEDRPVTRSEAIGIATAAAVAVTTDPDDLKNVPEPLRQLDPEQRAAAMTDGRVLIAAGAGSGKSTSLVARVAYLVLNRKVQPSEILVTSFNRVAADELKGRIAKAVGKDLATQMTVDTTHSICKHFVSEYGTREEVGMLSKALFVGAGGTVSGAVQRAWAQCFPDEEVPKVKDMMLAKTAWAGNGIKPAEAKQQARDAKEMTAAAWYEFYEGFKGAIPGWRPPMPCKEYENFMACKRPGGARIGDFDDQLGICYEILKRDPRVRKAIQSVYSHVLVDESQDLNSVQQGIFDIIAGHITDGSDGKSYWQIGDDKQCCSVDTAILLPDGAIKLAKDLQPGDTVLAYRNGVLCSQVVRHLMPSVWGKGYRVTTTNNSTLTISPNHQVWVQGAALESKKCNVHLTAHGQQGTLVYVAWEGTLFDTSLVQRGIAFQVGPKGERTISKRFFNYREALGFAQTLAIVLRSCVQEHLNICDATLDLVQAEALVTGMFVPVCTQGVVTLDAIVSVEEVDGTFVDLDIEDASNFFGGGILSHNSIYSFRGAKPEQFIALKDKPGWKTKSIRTNYRSSPEIVETANKLIAHNANQIPMEANPDARKARGVASIRVTKPVDDAAAALATVREIKANMADGGSVSDNAVLTRTNKELHNFETACIIKGVPYARKGASSFFGSPETSAVLGYVQLAMGNDSQKMQQALKDVINKPNRFFIAPDAGTAAVEAALSMHAHRTGTDIKVLNPLVALGDRRFQEVLAQRLTGQSYGFKYTKAIEKLANLGLELSSMRMNAGDAAYTMRDMFSDILNLKGVAGTTDSTGKTVWGEQTFRESLQGDLKNVLGDDDDTTEEDEDNDPETMGLGNVGFLYELAKADPDDPEDTLNDPKTPMGFKAKMDRYQAKMKDLRVDITKWGKEQEALPPEQRKPPPGVYLGTSHSTKGSQWPNVYVSMPKGKFPFERKPKAGEREPSPTEEQARMEQERRLAYVAITRPSKNLTIICPSSVGGKPGGVSPFVGEAGLVVGENVPKMNGNSVSKEATVAHWHLPRGVEVEDVPGYGRY